MTRRIRSNARKPAAKILHSLKDGPWEGRSLALTYPGDGNTGWVQIGEHVGRYSGGRWEAQS